MQPAMTSLSCGSGRLHILVAWPYLLSHHGAWSSTPLGHRSQMSRHLQAALALALALKYGISSPYHQSGAACHADGSGWLSLQPESIWALSLIANSLAGG